MRLNRNLRAQMKLVGGVVRAVRNSRSGSGGGSEPENPGIR